MGGTSDHLANRSVKLSLPEIWRVPLLPDRLTHREHKHEHRRGQSVCGAYGSGAPAILTNAPKRLPFAAFGACKLLVRGLLIRKMGCGGGFALAWIHCALLVAGRAGPWVAHMAELVIATAG